MRNLKNYTGKFVVPCLFALTVTACGDPAVSFSRDVKPILDQNCISCHEVGGKGEVASGFNLTSYEGVMKGTRSGPMVIAGDAEGSNMLVLIEGRADPSIRMPHGQQKSISKADIQTIRSWIEQGAEDN